ncbi:hypothetical protein [Brucella tritici]|uniref:hypothetical protein n=1 Tax=Brucella tritici TaxID=94626 RepID=UPI003D6D0D0C
MGIFLFILFTICALVIVGAIANAKGQEKKQEEQGKALQAIPSFRPAVKFDGANGGAGVAIDAENNKFAISDGGKTKVFSFSDLIAVEVLRDGSTVTKTNRGSQVAGAAVGAVLLGPVGLLLGGLTGAKRNEDKIERLSLKIFTNDLVSPVYEIVFYGGLKVSPDSILVKNGAKQLDEWHGRFQTILHMQTNNQYTTAPGSAGSAPQVFADR